MTAPAPAPAPRTYPLEPPYTRGSGLMNCEPILEGPLLARTRQATRWHRIKSGLRFPDGRVCWTYWCGSGAGGGKMATRSDLPTDGLPICGPCEGKALGAGYNGTVAVIAGESLLLFEPESQSKYRTPQRCPGTSRASMVIMLGAEYSPRVIRCGACGLIVPIGSWRGSRYNPEPPGPAQHKPLHLPEPCPFHAWDDLVLVDGKAQCRCGRNA